MIVPVIFWIGLGIGGLSMTVSANFFAWSPVMILLNCALWCLNWVLALMILWRPGPVEPKRMTALTWWWGLGLLALSLFGGNGNLNVGESLSLLAVGVIMAGWAVPTLRHNVTGGILSVGAGLLTLGVGSAGAWCGGVNLSLNALNLTVPWLWLSALVTVIPILTQNKTARGWGGVLLALNFIYVWLLWR